MCDEVSEGWRERHTCLASGPCLPLNARNTPRGPQTPELSMPASRPKQALKLRLSRGGVGGVVVRQVGELLGGIAVQEPAGGRPLDAAALGQARECRRDRRAARADEPP